MQRLFACLLSFLPQFVRADDPAPTTHLLALSLIFMTMTSVVFALYGLFAAAFVALGAKLAPTER